MEDANRLLLEYIESKDANLLDGAIWNMWRFCEYALNAGLELLDERADRGHSMGETAEFLRAKHLLRDDHSKLLEQLEVYRQKVEYGSFARKKASHFNRANVADCLSCAQAIREDIEAQLSRRGRLS